MSQNMPAWPAGAGQRQSSRATMAVGASSPRTASSSNSLTLLISVPMEMLVIFSRIDFDHHGNLELAHQRLGLVKRGRQVARVLHPDSLAAQALRPPSRGPRRSRCVSEVRELMFSNARDTFCSMLKPRWDCRIKPR